MAEYETFLWRILLCTMMMESVKTWEIFSRMLWHFLAQRNRK
jgi:hypothetical protein